MYLYVLPWNVRTVRTHRLMQRVLWHIFFLIYIWLLCHHFIIGGGAHTISSYTISNIFDMIQLRAQDVDV